MATVCKTYSADLVFFLVLEWKFVCFSGWRLASNMESPGEPENFTENKFQFWKQVHKFLHKSCGHKISS